jgi:hypothetical protein
MILSEWFTPAGALAVLHPADGFVFLALHTGVVCGLTALVAAATMNDEFFPSDNGMVISGSYNADNQPSTQSYLGG